VAARVDEVDDIENGCTTSRTDATRSGSSSRDGTRYGMPVAAIFFFARVMRACMVDSLTSSARATSGVERPQTKRSVSAMRASAASAG
jgi:hypothetical protein